MLQHPEIPATFAGTTCRGRCGKVSPGPGAVAMPHSGGAPDRDARLAENDRVVMTTGDHTGRLGGTNTLKLLRVGAGGLAEGLGEL